MCHRTRMTAILLKKMIGCNHDCDFCCCVHFVLMERTKVGCAMQPWKKWVQKSDLSPALRESWLIRQKKRKTGKVGPTVFSDRECEKLWGAIATIVGGWVRKTCSSTFSSVPYGRSGEAGERVEGAETPRKIWPLARRTEPRRGSSVCAKPPPEGASKGVRLN